MNADHPTKRVRMIILVGVEVALDFVDRDLFALGVTLIVARLVTYPFDNASREDPKYMKIVGDKTNSNNFWAAYRKAIPGISQEFVDLVTAMIAEQPAGRPTMAEFLGHPWMRGQTISQDEFGQHCAKFIEAANSARDAEQNSNGIDFQIPSAERNRRGGEGEGRPGKIFSHQN